MEKKTMENKTLENMRYCVEPVHPMAVRLYSDLVTINKFVKDNYQKDIDAAFDRASQQIGFVVTTTVPVMLEVGDGGAIKSLVMGSESLKNTPFEKEITAVFDLKKKGEKKINVSAGVYNLALFWYDAVKLRLRTDWMEPAQPVYQLQSELMGMRQSPQSAQAMSQAIRSQPWMEPVHTHTPWTEPVHHMPWMEPVHPTTPWMEPVHYPVCRPWQEPAHPPTPWMEPVHFPGCRPWLEPAHPVFQTAADLKKAGEAKTEEAKRFEHTEPVQYLNRVNQIIQERSILVSAIDEVYPELKLGERLNKAQYAMSPTLPLPPPRAVWPGVREPAHMMAATQWASGPQPQPWRQAMSEIAQVLGRHGPSPEPWKDQLLSEIASVMGKYSFVMGPGVPWRQMNFPGVKEPAHPMMTHPWWSSDPAQMAAVQPQMPQQMLSEMAEVMRKYGFQI